MTVHAPRTGTTEPSLTWSDRTSTRARFDVAVAVVEVPDVALIGDEEPLLVACLSSMANGADVTPVRATRNAAAA